MIQQHVRYTGSKLAARLLGDWGGSLNQFKKVFPKDYAQVLRDRIAAQISNIAKNEANKGLSGTPSRKEGIGNRG
jgi:glutamate synthase (ferredoxin)